VTFLFTDIEGSTRLWEHNPVEMKGALVRHDEILRTTIEAHAGGVFKYVGDAVFAAFGDPDDAVAAALEAQRHLVAEPWPEATPIRVRIGVHTGEAERLDNDYVGPTLNRTARLVDVAHGGQTLLSLETQQRLERTLPDGAQLEDMAAHRLRDLTQPERIFQLRHPDLPATFPPLRSLDVLPNNLPMRRSGFIGRDRELLEISNLLHTSGLLTLTGPAGCGKSRLALQVAADRLAKFRDGVWLAALAAVDEGDLVPARVAGALGLGSEPGRPFIDTLVDYVRPRQLLLVLDDCEHLVDASAALAQRLLEASPGLRILATSREALDTEAEDVWEVEPLAVPDADRTQRLEGDELVRYVRQFDAVQLFQLRANSATAGFEVRADNARDVAEVCRQLDGIPLAIELAAARLRVMKVGQIVARLGDRFDLLTDGRRDVLPRQQTLRALIDWSYDLLGDRERVLLARLSVFRGGWSLEAAEEICTGGPVPRARLLDLLTRLVAKSLVRVRDLPEDARYEFLHTIQEYAWARFADSPDDQPVHRRFADWMLRFVTGAAAAFHGPEEGAWLDRLDVERDNLRAALNWSTRQATETHDPDAARVAFGLAGGLIHYWSRRGLHGEGRARTDRVLSIPSDLAPPALRAPALVGAGLLANEQGDAAAARQLATTGLAILRELDDRSAMARALDVLSHAAQLQADYQAARQYTEASLVLHEASGDRPGIAAALHLLGSLDWEQGDLATAEVRLSRSLDLRREIGDGHGIAMGLNGLAALAYARGEVESARALFEESLALARDLGDVRNQGFVLNNLGHLAFERGAFGEARPLLEASRALKREVGDRRGEANTVKSLGDLALGEGDRVAAAVLYREALVLRRDIGDALGIAESLEGFAALALVEGDTVRAARCHGAAAGLRWDVGAPLKGYEQAAHAAAVLEARTRMGDADYAVHWADGRALSRDAATAMALGDGEAPA
jgi:predicted ATPase/class 3 adenylate cyclase